MVLREEDFEGFFDDEPPAAKPSLPPPPPLLASHALSTPAILSRLGALGDPDIINSYTPTATPNHAPPP